MHTSSGRQLCQPGPNLFYLGLLDIGLIAQADNAKLGCHTAVVNAFFRGRCTFERDGVPVGACVREMDDELVLSVANDIPTLALEDMRQVFGDPAQIKAVSQGELG